MPYIDGLYGGVEYHTFKCTSTEMGKLDRYVQEEIVSKNRWESVVSVFMFPSAFIPDEVGNEDIHYSYSPKTIQYTMTRPTKIGNYTPRNNKLLTFPYVFCAVDSLNDSKTYRYEWSDNRPDLMFSMACGFSPNPEIVCYPRNYNGTASLTSGAFPIIPTANPTESITCEGFPQCAVPIDSYRAWLAQKGASAVISGVGSIAGAGVGIALATTPAGAIAAGVLGAVGLAGTVASSVVEATKGNRTRGEQGGSTDVSVLHKGFWFKQMRITAQYARMIDDFFDRYGYACCQLKTPNINARRHWCYTKTKNASVDGDIPADDLKKIKKIFDNGVTFWKNGDEVDNYTLDNRV